MAKGGILSALRWGSGIIRSENHGWGGKHHHHDRHRRHRRLVGRKAGARLRFRPDLEHRDRDHRGSHRRGAADAAGRRSVRRLLRLHYQRHDRRARAPAHRRPGQTRDGINIRDGMRDKPWIFRTYAGHSTARDSNALYRKNLAKGEVGKVGVPICHLGDMRALFDSIPLAEMNTSMTINATAAWLLALYIAVADEQGAPREALQGTTQNDIIKEYLARGTYVFPPAPSMRLTKDVILFTTKEIPKWNPINVCSYHLQEAGATPVQELAFALATAIAVLDTVKTSGEVSPDNFGEVVGRISFFVNAGLKFVTELCKMRAFAELWNEITAERYGVNDPKQRLFRYGVQVNSLGLTEQQPENNVTRIVLE